MPAGSSGAFTEARRPLGRCMSSVGQGAEHSAVGAHPSFHPLDADALRFAFALHGTTSRHMSTFSRRHCVRGLLLGFTLITMRAQGMPGAGRTHGPPAN